MGICTSNQSLNHQQDHKDSDESDEAMNKLQLQLNSVGIVLFPEEMIKKKLKLHDVSNKDIIQLIDYLEKMWSWNATTVIQDLSHRPQSLILDHL